MKNQIPWNKDTKGLMVAWNKGIPWSEERKEHLRKAVKKAYESKELRDIHRQNTIRFLKNGGMKNKDTKIEEIGNRSGEKLHELLISEHESPNAYEFGKNYYTIINNCDDFSLTPVDFKEYSSTTYLMDKIEIIKNFGVVYK